MDINKMMKLNAAYKAATATEQAKEMAISKAHDYVVVGYTLISAANIILRETEKIMQIVNPLFRYDDKFGLGKAMDDLNKIVERIDKSGEKLEGEFWAIDATSYDTLRNNAFEILRFVLLLYTRTCGNQKASNLLNAYMQRMKSNGLFTDDEIAGFKLQGQ